MTVNVPLPSYDTLPVGVYFHREHPSDSDIILQIPNEDRTSSETHLVDLEKPEHKAWMEGLKFSNQLMAVLKFAKHVAYKPSTGFCQELQDLDEMSYGAQVVMAARRDANRKSFVEGLFLRRHNRSRIVPPFMQSLKRPR